MKILMAVLSIAMAATMLQQEASVYRQQMLQQQMTRQ